MTAPRERAHLHAVPTFTPPERHLTLLAHEYNDNGHDDPLDALLRRIVATPRFAVVPADTLHESVHDDDGIRVTACIRCNGEHYTPWDQIVIDHHRTDRQHVDGDHRGTYTACWMCPATGLDLEHLLGEGDAADAIEAGADPTDATDTAMKFAAMVALCRHPSSGGRGDAA